VGGSSLRAPPSVFLQLAVGVFILRGFFAGKSQHLGATFGIIQ